MRTLRIRITVHRILLVASTALAPLCGCERGIESGNGSALFEAGDYVAAHSALSMSAGAGDPIAQNYLGIQHYLGIGAARDLKAAANWFEKAAVQGNADAQLNLGFFHLYGYGLPRDQAQAFGWFQASSSAGNPRAASYLALLTDNLTGNQMSQACEAVIKKITLSAK